jgi:hypothetical protein
MSGYHTGPVPAPKSSAWLPVGNSTGPVPCVCQFTGFVPNPQHRLQEPLTHFSRIPGKWPARFRDQAAAPWPGPPRVFGPPSERR